MTRRASDLPSPTQDGPCRRTICWFQRGCKPGVGGNLMQSSQSDAKRSWRNRSLPVWAKTAFGGLRAERYRAGLRQLCAKLMRRPAFSDAHVISIISRRREGSAPRISRIAKLLVNWRPAPTSHSPRTREKPLQAQTGQQNVWRPGEGIVATVQFQDVWPGTVIFQPLQEPLR